MNNIKVHVQEKSSWPIHIAHIVYTKPKHVILTLSTLSYFIGLFHLIL